MMLFQGILVPHGDFHHIQLGARLFASGQLPPALIYGHNGFLPSCVGIPHYDNIALHNYAVDIARSPNGQCWVVSDRTQSPTGTSTQNQAFNAILFLLREVLGVEVGEIKSIRAKRGPKLPVVLSVTEAMARFPPAWSLQLHHQDVIQQPTRSPDGLCFRTESRDR